MAPTAPPSTTISSGSSNDVKVDSALDLAVQERRRLPEHLVQAASLLAHTDHVVHHGREDRVLGQAPGHGSPRFLAR